MRSARACAGRGGAGRASRAKAEGRGQDGGARPAAGVGAALGAGGAVRRVRRRHPAVPVRLPPGAREGPRQPLPGPVRPQRAGALLRRHHLQVRRGWDPPPPPQGEGAEGCGSGGDGPGALPPVSREVLGGRAGARRGWGPGGGTEGPGQPGEGQRCRCGAAPSLESRCENRDFRDHYGLEGEAPAIAVL